MLADSPATVGVDSAQLERGVAEIARGATRGRRPVTPGLVVMIGHQGRILFSRGYGHLNPDSLNSPLTDSTTIYDVASVTKALTTTIAVMQLIDAGKLRLSDRVNAYLSYWPTAGPAAQVRIGHLLTHTAGFGPGANDHLEKALARLEERDVSPARLRALTNDSLRVIAGLIDAVQVHVEREGCYTNVPFLFLGQIVEQITGEPLDDYAKRLIYDPLGLRETGFFRRDGRPPEATVRRIAASNRPAYKVNDPTAGSFYAMGRTAGHAGLFSSARDLALIAQELLDAARGVPNRLVSGSTMKQFVGRTWPETRSEADADSLTYNRDPWNRRGFGFDRAVASECPRYLQRADEGCDGLPPWRRPNREGNLELKICQPNAAPIRSLAGAFGHTGWTGPSVWIDPQRDMYVVIVMNHRHPSLRNDDDDRHVTMVRKPIDRLLAQLTKERTVSAK